MFLQEDNKNDPKKIVYLHDIIINKFPFIQKIIDSIGDIDDFIPTLMTYLLLLVFIALALDWIGVVVVDDLSMVAVYALASLFFLWVTIMIFLLITTVPVDIMNRFYKNKELGLDTWGAIWKEVKNVIFWTTILALLGYSVTLVR